MDSSRDYWDRFWASLTTPRVDPAQLEAHYRRLKEELPAPVFWLLGKTQSGKTSLIRALTDNTRAEIGNGIRPCTRTAQAYPFPNEEECLLRFLDTRGLGEVSYDPAEDLALFQDQAHLLLVIMKALDHAQQPVMDALKKIHKVRPDWPILVVQTSLHEGYPTPQFEHIHPYPYAAAPFPPSVPPDLARSLLKQREMVAAAGLQAQFVAVDFTLPEDGYRPVDYGLEALWSAIEAQLPLGLRSVLQRAESARQALLDLQYQAARPQIISYALAAGAAASVPVPMVDLPLVFAVQARMFQAVAAIYHKDVSSERIREIVGALGLGYALRVGGRELLKFIPGYGSAVAALYSGATTYALGLTLCAYFSRRNDGGVPNAAEFKAIYEQHFEEGRERLRTYLGQMRTRRAASDQPA